MIGIVSYSHSQEFQIPTTNAPEISYFKDGLGLWYYKVPYERAKSIDYWARKGISAQNRINLSKDLMEQVRLAKIASDSLSIVINRELFTTRNEVSILNSRNNKLQKQIVYCTDETISLKKDLKLLRGDNKKLKRKLFWKNFTIVGTYTAAGVLGAVMLFK